MSKAVSVWDGLDWMDPKLVLLEHLAVLKSTHLLEHLCTVPEVDLFLRFSKLGPNLFRDHSRAGPGALSYWFEQQMEITKCEI